MSHFLTKLGIYLSLMLSAAGIEEKLSINFAHLAQEGTGFSYHHNPVREDLNYRLAGFDGGGFGRNFISFHEGDSRFNGATGVIQDSGYKPRVGFSRKDGGPFRVSSIRFSGNPSFGGTFFFTGFHGPDQVYFSMRHISSGDHFEFEIDQSLKLTELRWEVWYSSPQIDEILVIEAPEAPSPPWMRLDFGNPGKVVATAGPFPVDLNLQFESSIDLVSWEARPIQWGWPKTTISHVEVAPEPLDAPSRFFRVKIVPPWNFHQTGD